MRKHGKLPFKILADEHFKYFEKYEVERSMGKVFLQCYSKHIKYFLPYLRVSYQLYQRFFDIAITDVFINEKGIVSDVLYAKKDSADHFPFEKVRAFSKEFRILILTPLTNQYLEMFIYVRKKPL